MTNNYQKVMSQKPDEVLIRIAGVDRNDYDPLAVEAAENELKIRGIDSGEIKKIIDEQVTLKEKEEKTESFKTDKANRFLHFGIDTVIIYIIFIGLWKIIINYFYGYDIVFLKFAYYSLFLISFFAYYVIMEFTMQKTVGKFISKTKVVRSNGEKPDLIDILSRTFYRIVPLDVFSFLFSKSGLHDKMSDTVIIKESESTITNLNQTQ